jgi:hypothetical protein
MQDGGDNMIKLSDAQITQMINQPESGMGYQNVEVEYQKELRKATVKATVYNGELLLWEEEPRSLLRGSTYEFMIKSASSVDARLIKSIKVVPPQRIIAKSAFDKFAERIPGKPATEGEPQKTKKAEIFMRFTAYKNDRRITPQRGLVPGTYATTEEDSKNVKNGTEAVERYALPDPKPAIYRNKIEPLEDTLYRKGTVQPAYGHKGGGVEVIFDNGTDDNTVTGLTVLPP